MISGLLTSGDEAAEVAGMRGGMGGVADAPGNAPNDAMANGFIKGEPDIEAI